MQVGGSRIYSFVLVCGEDASSREHQGGQGADKRRTHQLFGHQKSGRHQRAHLPETTNWDPGVFMLVLTGPPVRVWGHWDWGWSWGNQQEGRRLTACAGWSSEGPCDKMHRGKKVNRPSLATSRELENKLEETENPRTKATTSNID